MSHKEKKGRQTQSGLKRLPRDFPWMLLSRLQATFGCALGDVGDALTGVLRKKDPAEFHRWRQLGSLQRINCCNESNPHKAGMIRLITEVCSKYTGIESVKAGERRDQAIAKANALDSFKPIELDYVLLEAKAEIARLLPPVDLEQVYRYGRHGPGKTVLPSVVANKYFKYARFPYTVGPNAKPMLRDNIVSDERWYGALEATYRHVRGIEPWRILPRSELFSESLQEIEFNRIVTVPKDGTKDRTIAIEPMGNVMLQLGVDGIFRRALRTWHIDLDSQDRNRELARLGSSKWKSKDSLVTPASLDLSSASDRISSQLVELLLPGPWFDLLNRLRSPYGKLPDGSLWKYQRFSSMGNGYTFALETLIFAAIIRAVVRKCGHKSDLRMVAVYGDDCLYPRYLDASVRRYFEYCGFIVNHEKSFADGPVRESCGEDYYDGVNIRPVYLPARLECCESLLAFRNGLVLWFGRVLGCWPPVDLIDWLDSYLDVEIGFGPPLAEHRSEYRFANQNATPIHETTCVSRRRKPRAANELLFRKLMHPLSECSSDGGSRFEVLKDGVGALVVGSRTVFCYQAVDYQTASAVQPWDRKILGSDS